MSQSSPSVGSKIPVTRRQLGVLLGLAAVGGGAALERRPLMELADGRMHDLRLLVPNSPGSGYDMLARAVGGVLEAAGLTSAVEIFNVTGHSGITGIHYAINEAGDDRLLVSMGLGLVGGLLSNQANSMLSEILPIARLMEEPEIILVPANSPYRNISDLITAWKEYPAAILVGGGSSLGGPDHLAPMLTAEYVGLAPKSVNYIAHDGGGRLLEALLREEVTFAATGASEFVYHLKTGELRALAVAANERKPGSDVPTLREYGINVTSSNWRGLMAPPGLELTQRAELENTVEALVASPEWKHYLAENNWQDAYLSSAQFHAFLNEERARVRRVLGGLGLA